MSQLQTNIWEQEGAYQERKRLIQTLYPVMLDKQEAGEVTDEWAAGFEAAIDVVVAELNKGPAK